jgi:polar amino acid transport system substrate-binding protein
MKHRCRRFLHLAFVLYGLKWFSIIPAASADAPQDKRVADLVSRGAVRIGLHLPQFVKDHATGEIHGHGTGVVIEQVARALAKRLNVTLQLVGHPSPPALIECPKADMCDVGFLGYVANRTTDVSLSPPYIVVPFTFMVPVGSSIHSVADVDTTGTRVVAIRNHASTLALNRILKHAEIVNVEIPDEAFDLLRTGRADAWASPRPPLLEYSLKLPGSRVLDERYGANLQSMAVPKNQTERLEYVAEFLEEAKASGLVKQAIERAGERGIEVAPRKPEP